MTTDATYTVHAIYRNGVLDLLDPLDLPEGAKVHLEVHLDSTEEAEPTAQTPRTVPASRLSALVGVVSLGGDAIAESEALYDADWD